MNKMIRLILFFLLLPEKTELSFFIFECKYGFELHALDHGINISETILFSYLRRTERMTSKYIQLQPIRRALCCIERHLL